MSPSPSTRAGIVIPEHEFEAEHGLPEPLPPGERLLWQGAPDWRVLAREAFHLRTLALYFAVILGLRAATVLAQGSGALAALEAVVWLLPPVGGALGMVALLAWLSARTAAYTVTDRRVVMRVGIVLSLSFNLPYRAIEAAALHAGPRGSGDIALTLGGGDRIAWLHLWPHARPWRLRQPEPMLRCVPDAARVAGLLAAAWSAARGVELAAMDAASDAPSGRAAEAARRPAGVNWAPAR